MNYSVRKHRAAMAMADSDKKLGELEKIGLSLGIFDKQPIIDEIARLRAAGYKSPAQRWLEKNT